MENPSVHSSASQEAMDRLLRSQQQADAAVTTCRNQAVALLATARNQVLDIQRKADDQISLIHKQRGKKIKKRVQALILQNRQADAEQLQDPQQLSQAVLLLAARLTGGSGEVKA
ncbi:MAG: hypothetical protein G8345_11850 [Magnetococcales bacterium]|nr:hypothetical protein [Magnetococcales bacterium]NGZ27565.1 hypothetical protein [Magnetococcales bacterium]